MIKIIPAVTCIHQQGIETLNQRIFIEPKLIDFQLSVKYGVFIDKQGSFQNNVVVSTFIYGWSLLQTSSKEKVVDFHELQLKMIKIYSYIAKFKKEVMKVLVTQMNEKDLARLQQTFKNIDVDNSGTITVQELLQALQQEGSLAVVEKIEEIMENIIDELDYLTVTFSHKYTTKHFIISQLLILMKEVF